MTIHESNSNKIYIQKEGEQAPVGQAYLDEAQYPSISKIEDHFRKDVDDSASTAEKGVQVLLKAGAKGDSGEKPGLIDSEIQRLSREIGEERGKEKPNWTKIDYLIRQLASFLLRKAGKADQELTQDEIDRMREDIEKVKSTYNTTWSLITAIGSGGLSVIGGLIGLGGNAWGLSQLSGGAAKVSAQATQLSGMGQFLGNMGGGLQGAAAQPFDKYNQGKQRGYDFELQLSTHRKDAASASANQNRQMQQGSTSNLDRLNENMHSAATRVFGG